MSNCSKTLYVGVTNSLIRWVRQHKDGDSEFTSRYKLDRLVYYESYSSVHSVLARQKQIKRWRRVKKIRLIVSVNPEWKDLGEGWYEQHLFQPVA